ncbi:MAG: fatty acid desaturase [Desulfobulbia bacterium]
MISLIWIKDVIVDWVIIMAAVIIVIYNIWLLPISIIIIGTRQHALAILGHDATHKLVSKKRWLNEMLGNYFCFAPILIPWKGYRKFHAKHHKHLGTDQDPELPKKENVNMTSETANPQTIVRMFIEDLFLVGAFKSFKDRSIPREEGDLKHILIVHALILCLGFVHWIIPVMWYLSIFTSMLACTRLRVWHEHIGTDSTHKISSVWWQRWIFLPHNAEYHHEHHEHPAVPYNQLPEIAEEDRKKVSEIHSRKTLPE